MSPAVPSIARERPADPINSPAEMRDKAPETYDEKLAQLEELRRDAVHAGSDQAVAKQHERGKYTARERVEKLLKISGAWEQAGKP